MGAMVSKAAAKGLWPQISGFWAARDGAAAAPAEVPVTDAAIGEKLAKIERLVEKIEQAEKAPRPASKASAAARKK